MASREIEMHFREIMDLSEALKGLAKELSCISEAEMMEIICGIQAGWNSECADILVGKEVKIAARLTEEAVKLKELALEMESKAKKMYQSETENIRLAAVRIY